MRTRVVAAPVAMLAAVVLLPPETAQAAGCGTVDQWVGTYFYQPWWEEPDTYALRVEFTTVAPEGPQPVTTVDGQAFPQQEAPTYGSDGILTWTTAATHPQRYFADDVTCANGVVSSAQGEIWTHDGPPYGWIPIGHHELTRAPEISPPSPRAREHERRTRGAGRLDSRCRSVGLAGAGALDSPYGNARLAVRECWTRGAGALDSRCRSVGLAGDVGERRAGGTGGAGGNLDG